MNSKANYFVHLSNRRIPASIGNKAAGLVGLITKGFLVPDTYVCTWEAYCAYLSRGASVLMEIHRQLQEILVPDQLYAIRSSANIEDSREYSFAGQYKTLLDVRGVSEVIQAITEIWEGTRSEGVASYLQKTKGTSQDLKMAVIIQKMVQPDLSGVAFTKNPISGLDEIVIEAVHGLGTALVQDGITPMRWIYKWGSWISQPVNQDVPQEVIQSVVEQAIAIAGTLKRHLDLEWAYDGHNIYWLQARDITTTGQVNIYSNRMSKEVLPGLIKPLVWSVNLPIPGQAWVRLITQAIGKNNLQPETLAKAFHYRAYFNLGVFGEIFDSLGLPRESLEIVMGVAPHSDRKPKFKPGLKTLPRLPRLAKFAVHLWGFGRQAEQDYPSLSEEAQRYPVVPPQEASEQSLMQTIGGITHLSQRVSYYTVVSILLMQVYNGLLRSRLEKLGVDFQFFDLTEGLEELKKYDPIFELEAVHRLFEELPPQDQELAQNGDWAALRKSETAFPFCQRVAGFLDRFGHLSESGSDFSTQPWRETPGLIIQLIAAFRRRDEGIADRLRWADLQEKGRPGWLLKFFYQRARQFRLLREQYSSLSTYTLMLLRTHYLSLGDRLTQRGVLAAPEQIYYLYNPEVRACVNGQDSGQDFQGLVARRRAEMEAVKEVILPEVIYGDSLPLVVLTSEARRLAGTPTSRGYFTGPVTVVRGLSEFGKVQPGSVLVIPFSDVSWTPLFAKAGAVISESGGILSHSSIIAREYGIPAVVSVVNATHLLQDQQQVTVDGFKGEIILHATDCFSETGTMAQ